LISLISKRCANCGKRIRGRGLEWRGKYFCSKRCKKEYRERHKGKKRKGIFLPRDTFDAIYGRR